MEGARTCRSPPLPSSPCPDPMGRKQRDPGGGIPRPPLLPLPGDGGWSLRGWEGGWSFLT